MSNIHIKPPSLRFVSMPIIELIRSGELSWADIETCADALLSIKRHHKSMEDERKGMMVGAQQAPQGIVGSVVRAG